MDAVGDNLLADFSSAVEAVGCAIKIQEKLKKENPNMLITESFSSELELILVM